MATRRLGFVFLLIGLFGLSVPVLSLEVFNDNAFLGQVATEEVSRPTSSPSTDPNRPTVKDRLIIEKAGIDLALIQSQSSLALWQGGWVFPSDSTPDKGGNTVIFGHRFRYLPPISNTLYSLDKVQLGDQFSIIWKGVTYHYKVTEKKVVDPTDLSVLDQSRSSEVTIVTCWPLFSSKQRLVVVGTITG